MQDVGIAVINPFPDRLCCGGFSAAGSLGPFEPMIEYETSFVFPAGRTETFRWHGGFVDFVRAEQMKPGAGRLSRPSEYYRDAVIMSYDRIASISVDAGGVRRHARVAIPMLRDYIRLDRRALPCPPHGFRLRAGSYDETGLKANLWASIGPPGRARPSLPTGHTDVVPVDGPELVERPVHRDRAGPAALRAWDLRS